MRNRNGLCPPLERSCTFGHTKNSVCHFNTQEIWKDDETVFSSDSLKATVKSTFLNSLSTYLSRAVTTLIKGEDTKSEVEMNHTQFQSKLV